MAFRRSCSCWVLALALWGCAPCSQCCPTGSKTQHINGKMLPDNRNELQIESEALALARSMFSDGFQVPTIESCQNDGSKYNLAGGKEGAVLKRLKLAVRERRCLKCWMRQCVCICDRLEENKSELPSGASLTIFMHPGEMFQGSNTGHLIPPLLDPRECIRTIYFGVESEHKRLAEVLSLPNTLVLYPSPDAVDLSDLCKAAAAFDTAASEPSYLPLHLVVIDGTWKTAKKLVRLLKSSSGFPKVKFGRIPEADKASFDALRKRTREDGCSTIEAVAMAFESLGDTSTAACLRQGLRTLTDALDVQGGRTPRHGTYTPEEILITRRRIVSPHYRYAGSVSTAAAKLRLISGNGNGK